MSDPFSFEGIRRAIPVPKELELRSFHEALSDLERTPETVLADPDVSMADAASLVEESPAIENEIEMNDAIIEPEPLEIPSEQEKDVAPDTPDTPEEETKVPDESTHGVSLLSPTKLGAQHALALGGPITDNTTYPSGIYEVDMPIPAPWHHNLPYILSTYLQLIFNTCILFLAFWLVREFNRDVQKKVSENGASLLRQAAICAHLYVENECHPSLTRPALRDYCLELEECMERDPSSIKMLAAYASALSEICNEFFDSLTYRSIILLGGVVVGALFIANYLFGFIRAKTYYRILSHPPQAEMPRANYRIAPLSADGIWRH